MRHKTSKATFSLRKQQLCTIFRTLVTGQSRVINWSVMYLPKNVHGGNASQGTIFAIQAYNNKNDKIRCNFLNVRAQKLPLNVGILHESMSVAMRAAQRSNYFGMHAR